MGIDDQMMFEIARDALKTLLETYQTNRYRVVTGQKQSFAANQFKETDRAIQIFYFSGDYPKASGSAQRLDHRCTIKLEYYVAAPSKVNRSVLDDDGASAAEKQAALANMQQAFYLADQEMDEFRRMITQVIMAPQNQDLGLTRYKLSDRWLSNFQKSQPIDHGRLVLVTATENLEFRVTETLTGITPTAAVSPVVDTTLDQQPIDGTEVTSPSQAFQPTT